MAYIKTVFVEESEPGMTALVMNNITDAVDSLRLFPTAGGTGTVITVTDYKFTLAAGASLTFIASAANAAAATTLNVNGLGAKSIYKPGGTDAPNIISGKAYTVWYDTASGGRFFVKASAEGDAVVADVLAGKTFSNDDDTGLTGTLTIPHDSQSYTTPGTYTFTVPDNVTQVTFVSAGGGGGGGGSSSSHNGGPGGGSGAYTNIISVTPQSTLDVVVGTAGTAGSYNSSTGVTGGTGGNSSVDAYIGYGGVGGTGGDATVNGTGGAGGAGGGYGGYGGKGGVATTNVGGRSGAGAAGGTGVNGAGAVGGGGGSYGIISAAGGAGGAGKVVILW